MSGEILNCVFGVGKNFRLWVRRTETETKSTISTKQTKRFRSLVISSYFFGMKEKSMMLMMTLSSPLHSLSVYIPRVVYGILLHSILFMTNIFWWKVFYMTVRVLAIIMNYHNSSVDIDCERMRTLWMATTHYHSLNIEKSGQHREKWTVNKNVDLLFVCKWGQ